MSLQIMRLLVIVGLLQLTFIPSCRSESRVNSLFGSRVAPDCRPGEYYKLPHDEYCEMYYECEDQEIATEKTCEPGFLYYCQREICLPVSAETDISEVCCAGLVTRDPLPETSPIIPTVPTITPPTDSTITPPTSPMTPDCRPGEYYKLPHDEYCEMYYECEDQEVATEKTCEPAFMYHCQREICFPVSADTDISEVCCAGLVTRDPLPETTPIIPTVPTITPPTSPGQTSTGTPPDSTSTATPPTSTGTPPGSTETETPEGSTSTETNPGSTETAETPEGSTETAETPEGSTETAETPEGSTETAETPEGSTSTETNPGSTETESPSTPTSTGTSPVTEIPDECRPAGEHSLPNPDDCSKYTRCLGGKPTFQDCPGCYLFDINRFQCVEYDSAECLNGTTRPPYNPAVCSGCILSNWRLLTVTFILIIAFVNTNNLLV